MAFYAYLLRCQDGSYYTGHTEDLEVRLAQHERGTFPGYTHKRRPVTLVWSQDFPLRDEALAAERRIKGWSRAKKEALIAGDWERLSVLARNRQDRERPSTSSGRTGEGGDLHTLLCHPATPASQITAIVAECRWASLDTLSVRVVVRGDVDSLRLSEIEAPERRDGLWQTTCFELFAQCATGYVEYNFAPSGDWAAYRFAAYREGMALLEDVDPPVNQQAQGPDSYAFEVQVQLPKDAIGKLSLTAVIEETDGTKSYWALAHPPGKPDFHDPACFVLELPAADAA